MIKLIVSDIDGTLLEDGGHAVNPELLDVILKLREKGVQFAAASGRQWLSIEGVFEPIKKKVFYISDNGAYVGCHGRNLFLNPVDRDAVLDVVRDVRKEEGLEVMLSGANVVYLETKDQDFVDWMINGYQFHVRQVEDLTAVEDDFIKLSVYKKHEVEEAAGFLKERYQDRFKITIAGDMWMDFMKPGVSKGGAVKLLQDSLEISPKETMAFGDQLNDLEMLEQAYYSFAVGNAREEVKKAARFQTDENVKDGVLKVLKLLL